MMVIRAIISLELTHSRKTIVSHTHLARYVLSIHLRSQTFTELFALYPKKPTSPHNIEKPRSPRFS